MPSTLQHRELLWFFLMSSKAIKIPPPSVTSPPSLTGLVLKTWRAWWSAHLHRFMYIEPFYSHPCTGSNVVWRPARHLLMVQKNKTRSRCFPNRELSLAHTEIPVLSPFFLFLAFNYENPPTGSFAQRHDWVSFRWSYHPKGQQFPFAPVHMFIPAARVSLGTTPLVTWSKMNPPKKVFSRMTFQPSWLHGEGSSANPLGRRQQD